MMIRLPSLLLAPEQLLATDGVIDQLNDGISGAAMKPIPTSWGKAVLATVIIRNSHHHYSSSKSDITAIEASFSSCIVDYHTTGVSFNGSSGGANFALNNLTGTSRCLPQLRQNPDR